MNPSDMLNVHYCLFAEFNCSEPRVLIYPSGEIPYVLTSIEMINVVRDNKTTVTLRFLDFSEQNGPGARVSRKRLEACAVGRWDTLLTCGLSPSCHRFASSSTGGAELQTRSSS